MKNRILVIEKLYLLSLLYFVLCSKKFKKAYYFSEAPFLNSSLMGAILSRLKKLERLRYKDFPGAYFQVQKESAVNANDKFYDGIRKNNAFIDSLLKFKNDSRVELSLRYLLLQEYTVHRVKAYFFLKRIIEKNNYLAVFVPLDNIDFSQYISTSLIPLKEQYSVPASIMMLNKLKEAISRIRVFTYALKQIVALLVYRGITFRKINKKEFTIAFDILKYGIHWNDTYHEAFLYGDEPFRPEKILHVIRDRTTDEKTIKYFEEKSYPYVEFGRIKIPISYFIRRVLLDYYFKMILKNFLKFFTSPSQHTRAIAAVAIDTILTEIFYAQHDIKVFVARDEGFHTHILRTIILNESGGKTVGFVHGDDCLVTTANAYICFDYFCLWSEFHKNLLRKGLNYTRNVETIGPGIYGLDRAYKYLKENKIPEWYNSVKQEYKIITVFGSSFNPDLFITKELVLYFYRTVLSLLKKHEDVFIVIKPKGSEFKNEEFQKLLAGYERVRLEDGRNTLTYELIPISDLMICINCSTVGIEGMAAGKRVLYFDVTNFEAHPYRKYNEHLVSFTPEDLYKNVNWVLEGNYLHVEELERIRTEHSLKFDGKTTERFKNVIRKALPSDL